MTALSIRPTILIRAGVGRRVDSITIRWWAPGRSLSSDIFPVRQAVGLASVANAEYVHCAFGRDAARHEPLGGRADGLWGRGVVELRVPARGLPGGPQAKAQ